MTTPSRGDVVVGIPTVTRYDLLRKSILCLMYSSRPPDRVIVIDNGRGFENPFAWAPVEVVRPPYNLGVAASWNEIHRRAHGDVIIFNDDVMVGPRTLENMLAADGPFVTAMPIRDWSGFLQRDALWQTVGPYDEGFWPAYHEDLDYRRRMRLDGVSVQRVASGGIAHRVSATKEGAGYEPSNIYVDLVLRRYRHKWGGPMNEETFDRPWAGRPESWDDLEESYRYLVERAPKTRPQMEALRRLAADCRHVTSLGCGRGFLATALLTGKPNALAAVDYQRHAAFDHVFRLARLYTDTRVTFQQADSLSVELEPTDLLLIDTTSAYPHTLRELEAHAPRVRRWIAVHNTTLHGRDGSLPRAQGVLTAIEAFLGENHGWRLAEIVESEKGLAILERAP